MPPSTESASPGAADDLALLTGSDASQIVAAGLAANGTDVSGLTVAVASVHHRPGVGVSVCFDVTTAAGPAAQQLVVTTAQRTRHEGDQKVAVLDDGERALRMWWCADDPALPGLAGALDPVTVASWMGRIDTPTVQLLSYRPTRRAVVAARFAADVIYIKVVRARRAAALVRRHQLLAAASVPAPAVLGEPAPGAIIIEGARGMSLAQSLASQDPSLVPQPEAVLDALDGLPAAVTELTLRPSWVDRLQFHAAAASAALPQRADVVEDVRRRIEGVLATSPPAPLVPTHGDLNVANLFVDGGLPSRFIDVDSLGPGRRADDVATLIAHLMVLQRLAPDSYPQVPALVQRWRSAFIGRLDAADLDARTAAVLISLIAGSDPTQANHRLDLAHDVVGRAQQGAS